MRFWVWFYGVFWQGSDGGSFLMMKGGIMIEVNLTVLSKVCIQQLEILAAVRCMCTKHGLPIDWICEWESEVAGVLKDLRLLRTAQGDTLILDD